MTVPDFQTILLPLLRVAGDQREHSVSESVRQLAEEFRLSQEDRRQLLPSGRQATFDNRVGWARTYLAKAGLLENTGRGRFRITPRGLEVLGKRLNSISISFLRQFPEFVEFHTASRKEQPRPVVEVESPEEMLETGYQNLRLALVAELLDRVKKCSPQFFERLVVDLPVAMGYGGSRKDAGQAVGQSGDGGIDGIIKEDRLGLDIVYIQAKRQENTVGRPTVQAFAGSLEGFKARKGVFITTSQFTKDAKDYVNLIEKRIILIDGVQLAQLMIDFDVGVTQVTSYAIKKADLDYFPEDSGY